jgi:hypothetical protein
MGISPLDATMFCPKPGRGSRETRACSDRAADSKTVVARQVMVQMKRNLKLRVLSTRTHTGAAPRASPWELQSTVEDIEDKRAPAYCMPTQPQPRESR